MKLKCKNCKYFKADRNGQGDCTIVSLGGANSEDYFRTTEDKDCCYLQGVETNCIECEYLTTEGCAFELDKNNQSCERFSENPDNIVRLLYRWVERGNYSREKIMSLCDDIEKSERFRIIQKLTKEKG